MTKIDEATQDFSADLATLREDITKLTTTVTDMFRSQATNASDTFYGAADTTRQRFTDKAGEAQDRVSAMSEDLGAAVQRNPLAAIGIAVGAGIFIGMLSRSR